MKTCPRCARSFPDSESFCEDDGTALVTGSGAAQEATQGTTLMGEAESAIECPVCGGKAQPGEIVCNFCGARLVQDTGAGAMGGAAAEQAARPAGSAPRRSPETFIPAQDKLTATDFTPPPDAEDEGAEEEEAGRPLLSIIGYTAAAVVALVAGAWLALRLSSGPAATPPKLASATPVPSAAPAAPTGPLVQLARSVSVQTIGESAAAPERNTDAARKVFDSNKSALLGDYRGVLASGSAVDDGMMVRLTVAPSGDVTGAAVRTSTAPNPELDAAVVKSMMGWKFTPFNGGEVSADYPVIFARDAVQAASIDSSLSAKVAALSPAETPEYASAPPPAAPLATPSPALEAAAPPAPPALAPESTPSRKRLRRPRELAAVPPRRLPLLERVQSALRSNRKLGRVKAYTNGSVVTLYGRVFDDNGKRLAERTVRGLDGVTDVIDQLTTDKAQWAADELRISQSLASAGLSGVTVKVIGRDAYLDGQVPTSIDRERAVTIAEGAAAVKVRSNLIRVAPGSVFGF
jgi:TonB family protein